MSRSFRKNPCLYQRARSGHAFKRAANQRMRRGVTCAIRVALRKSCDLEDVFLAVSLREVSNFYDLYDWPTRMSLGYFLANRKWMMSLTRRKVARALSK